MSLNLPSLETQRVRWEWFCYFCGIWFNLMGALHVSDLVFVPQRLLSWHGCFIVFVVVTDCKWMHGGNCFLFAVLFMTTTSMAHWCSIVLESSDKDRVTSIPTTTIAIGTAAPTSSKITVKKPEIPSTEPSPTTAFTSRSDSGIATCIYMYMYVCVCVCLVTDFRSFYSPMH